MMKKHFAGHWSNTPGPALMLVIQSENGETASLHVVSLVQPIYLTLNRSMEWSASMEMNLRIRNHQPP